MKAKINCNAGCCEILESVWNQWMSGICTSYFRNIQGSDLQTTINQVWWFEESFKHVCTLHTNKQQAALCECLSISNFFRAFEVFFFIFWRPAQKLLVAWAANDALLRQEKPPRRFGPLNLPNSNQNCWNEKGQAITVAPKSFRQSIHFRLTSASGDYMDVKRWGCSKEF